ncbi:phosphatidate cytidylyltransferase [Ascoidea rubescens DSM 1968]|uniref:Phosphatidate cytidylyltransferase n=1 Tax=Ascoidea rubescens DSM 1968 TaxID=1344418 RepID=A0A1D2VQI2_9ASCO|nr:putative phosphatidate cytidylyltransferase [Ascoidea rubescens DSM 1968]ODV63859.1 putative phosphatidate cytidylyltransferase [Ascoidea rubescens DSM 1968]
MPSNTLTQLASDEKTSLKHNDKTGPKPTASKHNAVGTKTNTPASASRNASSKGNTLEFEKKKQNFLTRALSTFIMIFGFFGIVIGGHLWTILLVLVLQILTFKEVISITYEPARYKRLPYNRSLNWYFLATSLYYLDGKFLIFYFKHVILLDTFLTPLATHHKFISYCLYVLGIVLFVCFLQKGYYKFQFAQLCATHMTLILVVLQAHFIINNILTGMFWFFLPVSLVIVNDIFAYICGITFGKTRLIAISPKKTVEGFVGAWIFTVLFSLLITFILSPYKYIICPVDDDLSVNIIKGLDCELNPVFIPQEYRIPPMIAEALHYYSITIKPIYFHAIVLATFASLIAPFGGFFCSGLKRAFKVKDFADTIPGHGGITDRMDCQFIMGSFSYLYYETFISTHKVSVSSILQMAVVNLDPDQVTQLIDSLLNYLHKSGRLNLNNYNQIIKLVSESSPRKR